MKFAALGRTHWLRDSIRAVAARGHQPVLIATAPAAPEYRCDERDFEALARELRCTFVTGSLRAEPAASAIDASGADVAISVNWPAIIDAKTRAKFRHGVLNAHAGDLPKFRGNACPNWAILAGESRVVVTIHEMAEELDAGPVLLQRACPLSEATYIADVYAFMEQNIPAMFAEAVDGLAAGTIARRPQSADPSAALRCYPRRPEDGWLDWRRRAVDLHRLVRASAEPFAGAFFIHDGRKVIVWRARAEAAPTPYLGVPGQVAAIRADRGEVAVLTGDGVLILEEVESAGGGRQPAATLITSTRDRLQFDPVAEFLRLSKQ